MVSSLKGRETSTPNIRTTSSVAKPMEPSATRTAPKPRATAAPAVIPNQVAPVVPTFMNRIRMVRW